MAFCASAAFLIVILLATPAGAIAASDRVAMGGFAIDRNEVTIVEFAAFTEASKLKTAAEREGGGHEWERGWKRRRGWSFRTPFGSAPQTTTEPAVHVNWHEAQSYCASVGGRLPTRDEWRRAAYREEGGGSTAGFVIGTTYPYPTGADPEGANTSGVDQWPRHAARGMTRQGVNGLYDMGGNVWEWLADRDGVNALTAGGSWWYGSEEMREDEMQWKPAGFYVVYIGFRCAYDIRS
ncbi:formylglycine-generating enzyme family protein [Rhizobium sp. BT-175]|uniref:formylglycine-generating enzyme family protein n=1 Tax=Rhizobium sp. BT-175 TaxID=2986929 RepID=UPI002235CD51|nr:formylglycine-generating enzyme family protein [Rhizobium sp. BT-175]MCV9947452.1 formylglycine-generating enzyme family protein [Rhizobium sp. BT-175]